jgi:hypothetical protein
VTHNELPAEATAWLAAAEHALLNTATHQRTEIMDGLRSHITEALARGEAVDDVLERLGPPADVADPDGEDLIRQPEATGLAPVGPDHPPRRREIKGYLTAKRIAQLSGFALAFLTAACISLLPGYVETTVDPATGQIIDTTSHIALFSMDPRTAATLAAAILLTAVPPLVRGRAMQPVTICVAALTVLLAFSTMMWIVGWFILPVALATVIAAALSSAPRDQRLSRLKAADA